MVLETVASLSDKPSIQELAVDPKRPRTTRARVPTTWHASRAPRAQPASAESERKLGWTHGSARFGGRCACVG